MVHTLELSREISEDTFELLLKSLKANKHNGYAWFTTAYTEQGISMICLHKFKPKRKDNQGKWVTLESEPYHYMIILGINTGVMFGGDGYLSNNVLTFTSDFAYAIYDKILEILPQLEIYPEYRVKGYELYWNTGRKPSILDDYYRLNAFKLRRIDYALDISLSAEQYIQLLQWGKGINRKSFKRMDFDKSKSLNVVELTDVNVDDTDIIDDDEPDFDDIEELMQDFKSDTRYIYYKSKSVNINIYLKGEQLHNKGLIESYNPLYDFLRIEIQVKKNKLNYINRKHNVHGREFHTMPIPEYEKEILSYYINQLAGTGLYVTYDRAVQILEHCNFKPSKLKKIKRMLYLFSQYQSVKTVMDKVKGGQITELGAYSTVQSYVREIEHIGINPVTISRNMKKSIIPSEITVNGKTQYTDVVLASLVSIFNVYNEQLQYDKQYGQTLTQENIEQIDKL